MKQICLFAFHTGWRVWLDYILTRGGPLLSTHKTNKTNVDILFRMALACVNLEEPHDCASKKIVALILLTFHGKTCIRINL